MINKVMDNVQFKLVGLLLGLLIIGSCKTNNQKLSESSMDNNAKIEFSDSLGNKISKEDLAKSTGTFNYEILGIDDVPEAAVLLHRQARQYGQEGDYEKAIEALNHAHEQAPDWPYPVYDLAYTYLLKDDYENAIKYYRLTDSLAPRGFYTSKTALHTLEKELKGEFVPGLYRMFLSLEWMDDPKEKLEMTKILVSKFPTFAPGWKEYSNLLEGEERNKAIDKGLELDSDAQTKGTFLINKALMMNQDGNQEEAVNILTSLIFDPNTTFGNIEMAKFVLNDIVEN